jgi:acylphosphatase
MPDRAEIEIVARVLHIHGRVQGVWYRASAQQEAVRLGLSGWVRNRADGSVEALVAGPAALLEAFIDWARRGPPKACVERIDISIAELPEGDGFEVRGTP